MKKLHGKLLSLLGVFILGGASLLQMPVFAAELDETQEVVEEAVALDEAVDELASLEGTMPEHISIAGTDVSGMDVSEAKEIVDDYVAQYEDVVFTLKVDDKSIEADSEDIGLCAKNADVVARALHYGKEGNLISRYKAITDMANGKQKDFALSLTADINTAEKFLQFHSSDLVVEAKDNAVKRENGEFVYVEGTEGVELLAGKSAVVIADYIATKWDGKDATIEMLTQKDTPRGTKEELANIKDLLGSFNTNFGTVDNGRTKNVKVGASKLDGVILYPGETISVSDTIGPTTAENGYFLAGSYENGTTVETYGGGICQVSSTLYNAVLNAELEIVTRSAHSMIVSYVEPSKDAAIADGIKDFQFKNNKDYPIYIEGYTSGGNLYFNIYGKETRDPGHKVEYVSEVTSQTDPEKEYVAVAEMPIGYMETTTKPHVGYTARLWKVVYENGVEVSRNVINNSRYNPSKEVISVGVGTDNGEAAAAINNAIAAKDEAAIQAAIGTWNAEAIAARNQAAASNSAPKPTPPASSTTPTTGSTETGTSGESASGQTTTSDGTTAEGSQAGTN